MSFEVSRLRRGDRIVAVGAIALFVFMCFFKWYGVDVPKLFGAYVSAAGYSTSFTGWHTLTTARWFLLLAILAGVVLVALVGSDRKLELPLGMGVIVTALGALATLLVFYRTIVSHPGGSSVSVKLGAYLGLVASAVLTYGGYVVMTHEGTSLGDVRDQARASFDSVTTPGATDTPVDGEASTPGETSTQGEAPTYSEAPPPAPPAAPQV